MQNPYRSVKGEIFSKSPLALFWIEYCSVMLNYCKPCITREATKERTLVAIVFCINELTGYCSCPQSGNHRYKPPWR